MTCSCGERGDDDDGERLLLPLVPIHAVQFNVPCSLLKRGVSGGTAGGCCGMWNDDGERLRSFGPPLLSIAIQGRTFD